MDREGKISAVHDHVARLNRYGSNLIGISSAGLLLEDGSVSSLSISDGDPIDWVSQLSWTRRPICVSNDGICAAAAEVAAGSLDGVKDGVILHLGTGIAGALFGDGQILNTATLGNIELQFLPIPERFLPDDTRAGLDESSLYWGRLSGGRMVEQRLALLCDSLSKGDPLRHHIMDSEYRVENDRALTKESQILEGVMRPVAASFGIGLAVLGCFFHFSRAVVTGPVVDGWGSEFINEARRNLEGFVPPRIGVPSPHITRGEFASRGPLIGASLIARKHFTWQHESDGDPDESATDSNPRVQGHITNDRPS